MTSSMLFSCKHHRSQICPSQAQHCHSNVIIRSDVSSRRSNYTHQWWQWSSHSSSSTCTHWLAHCCWSEPTCPAQCDSSRISAVTGDTFSDWLSTDALCTNTGLIDGNWRNQEGDTTWNMDLVQHLAPSQLFPFHNRYLLPWDTTDDFTASLLRQHYWRRDQSVATANTTRPCQVHSNS